ncbi:GNAT family N-acetyltransferase [Aminobacter sp. UC22_36]|uniref:GNAT family N-acetyltransferase n=1 Tax=Aminobacter sp. UC22_36 TaxID=3374549 RepID=UPI003756B6EE
MIILRPMRNDEYSGYLSYFIPDYAAEISRNFDMSEAQAFARARQEISDDLPDGPNTDGEVLLTITDSALGSDVVIGYFWYRPDKTAHSAFISDFHILPAYQGNGYGKGALAALEATLSQAGFEQIRLRVAADNARAHHLYDVVGFRTTGINMSKRIGRPRS